ncbi:MAG: hypothetical protein LC664_01705, partial [Flavobacteriales bacterium]|nr:hypothetical protein [Flavobacteriales bacterium]
LLLCLFTTAVFSQEEDSNDSNSLDDQFNELKKSSNNYQDYKVVKKVSLDEFWTSVADTLKKNNNEINSLNEEVKSLKAEVSSLQSQVAERDESMAEQKSLIDNMEFLGIPISKGSYKTFTWIIIFALLIIALILYFRFNKANKVTVATRKEFESLQNEFDAHRQKSRENETKLKRELQTELNRVEELKMKLGDS